MGQNQSDELERDVESRTETHTGAGKTVLFVGVLLAAFVVVMVAANEAAGVVSRLPPAVLVCLSVGGVWGLATVIARSKGDPIKRRKEARIAVALAAVGHLVMGLYANNLAPESQWLSIGIMGAVGCGLLAGWMHVRHAQNDADKV